MGDVSGTEFIDFGPRSIDLTESSLNAMAMHAKNEWFKPEFGDVSRVSNALFDRIRKVNDLPGGAFLVFRAGLGDAFPRIVVT